MWQWADAYEIDWSYYVPHHPEEAGLIKWWNGLVKTKLQHQLGGNTLQVMGKVLQKAVYVLNQHTIYGHVSPIARIHWCRNQGVEMGVTSLIITPRGPLAKFLLSDSAILYPVGREVLVPKGEVPP